MNNNLLIYRKCPLCGSDKAKVKYKRNYDLKEIKDELFSARRERKKGAYEHNTFLECDNCGMIYANPILNPSFVEKLYKRSKFNYGNEEKNLKKSYGALLKIADRYVNEKGKLLDIGAGNGFFLDESLSQGYKKVFGIEPSKHAVGMGKKNKDKKIVNDILKPKQFKKEFFEVITIFQTIDHLEEPNNVLKICNKYLKTGGLILCISHDVKSFSAKIMGERSPIFDIEHTQLFSKKTIAKILENNGFKVVYSGEIANTFAIGYWIMLSPLPKFVKNAFGKVLRMFGLENREITIKPGNFGVIARKIKSLD